MAEEAKAKARKAARPKMDALVTWRMENFPAMMSQNKMYADKLVQILDRRIRRTPVLYALYNRGRLVSVGQSDQGVARMRASMMANKRRMFFDRFAVYTLAKRRQLNDLEALANRIAFPQKAAKNFTRARNLGDTVRRDVRTWASQETRRINRTLRPVQRRYDRTMRTLDRREKKMRASYSKRIMKANDKMRQKALRIERDKRLRVLSAQRKRLQPLRNSITQWNARLKTFQNMKI